MDVGDVAAVLLFLSSAEESAVIEMCVKMERATIGARFEFRVAWQMIERLQNLDERFGLFTADIEVEDVSAATAVALLFTRVVQASGRPGGAGGWLVASGEGDFPSTIGSLLFLMGESFLRHDREEREWFKRNDQEKLFILPEVRCGQQDFAEGFASLTDLVADIQFYSFCAHRI
jgi:hypothetical protein